MISFDTLLGLCLPRYVGTTVDKGGPWCCIYLILRPQYVKVTISFTVAELCTDIRSLYRQINIYIENRHFTAAVLTAKSCVYVRSYSFQRLLSLGHQHMLLFFHHNGWCLDASMCLLFETYIYRNVSIFNYQLYIVCFWRHNKTTTN